MWVGRWAGSKGQSDDHYLHATAGAHGAAAAAAGPATIGTRRAHDNNAADEHDQAITDGPDKRFVRRERGGAERAELGHCTRGTGAQVNGRYTKEIVWRSK